MPSFCAVLNCSDKYGHADSISFHKFPFKRKELLDQWLTFTERGSDWKPSRWSAICSRHFPEQEFNCVNERKTLKKTAVPSVRLGNSIALSAPAASTSGTHSIGQQQQRDKKSKQQQYSEIDDLENEATIKQSEKSTAVALSGMPKVNCRLCGCASAAVVSFATNFEIYGMIQKCFPTLNIHQHSSGGGGDDYDDDSLPKDMCRTCLKRLEGFSRFIDQVLETQNELQRKCRLSEGNKTSARASEPRPTQSLKIKQEPVVRVKQEVAEGFDSFLSDDLDMMAVDEEHDAAAMAAAEGIVGGGAGGIGCDVDQKYQFCDLPMLNTQDIINNCDIMEIINLDDPFIDIPDDDGATTINGPDDLTASLAGKQQLALQNNNHNSVSPGQQQHHLPSAYELLQTHLLIEEHNYAYAAAYDLKDEWQLKNCYKTEKMEDYEQQKRLHSNGGDPSTNRAVEFAPLTSSSPHLVPQASSLHLPAPLAAPPPTSEANDKPIVTSVASVAARATPAAALPPADPRKLILNATGGRTTSGDGAAPTNLRSHPKANIVVLNESIVQSSSAFQFHACAICQLKFFSAETLQQHFTQAHNQTPAFAPQPPVQCAVPMVSVPSENIPLPPMHSMEGYPQQRHPVFAGSCKVEQGVESESSVASTMEYAAECHLPPPAPQPALLRQPLDPPSRNRVDILEMQQSFGAGETLFSAIYQVRQHQDGQHQPPSNAQPPPPQAFTFPLPPPPTHMAAVAAAPALPTPTATPTPIIHQRPSHPQRVPPPTLAATFPLQSTATTTMNGNAPRKALAAVAANFKRLQRRYRQLQRKCQSLQSARRPADGSAAAAAYRRPKRTLTCALCGRRFLGIFALLAHKQRNAATHHVRKPRTRFAATCAGCERFFRTKLALRNHMRYICQSLPLRWSKTHLQTFKCRHCRRISFTHWRLCRRHELHCRQKQQLLLLHQQQRHKGRLTAKLRRSRVAPHYAQHGAATQQRMVDNNKYGQPRAPHADHKRLISACNLRTQPQVIPARNGSGGDGDISAYHRCRVCDKTFKRAFCLSQHEITHTEGRQHKCTLCARRFKRRNGLTQHMRGYHLQLKPFECPICQHRYALKCDMQRCRHSSMR